MNYDQMKSTLFEALREAGALVAKSLNERRVVEKKTELSIVTETDHKAEKIVIDIIKRDFPDHAILAEESLGQGDSPYKWIIDPIDGTTNFAHTYPIACVSIGFEENGEMVMGGVYDPFRDELFFAQKGKGAFLNDQPIQVSEIEDIGEALCATGFPYDRRERLDVYLNIIRDALMHIQGIRRTGSSAMDFCYVACGRFDAYWECNLQPWDVAAASLILTEAGGHFTDYAGNDGSIYGYQFMASNAKLFPTIIQLLEPYKELRALTVQS